MKNKIILFSFITFIFLGCTTPPKVIEPETVKNSKVEIEYGLGHSRYQFLAEAAVDRAEISSWKDDKVLEKKEIPLDVYLGFAEKVHEAIESYEGPKEVSKDCRTPFAVSLTSKKETYLVTGCRGEHTDSKIGQVIKEGEYLFYSE